MATLSGAPLPSPVWDGPWLDPTWEGFGGEYVGPSPQPGSLNSQVPVAFVNWTLTGKPLPGWAAWFYQGIHIVPGLIDVGNLLKPETYPVEVWNATTQDQLLDAIDQVRTEGINLTEPTPPPTTFLPLESRFYEVEVTLEGPGRINASYTWRFPPNDPLLQIIGWRIAVFGLSADWGGMMTEAMEWLTDIIEAYDGSEQRIEQRGHPRRGYELLATLPGHEAAVMESLLFGWQSRLYGLPIWMDRSRLDADLDAGSTTIPVSTQYMDYHEGGLAVLWQGPQSHESVEISGIASDEITLVDPIENAWPAGTWIMPLVFARVPSEASVERITDELVRVRLPFLVQPGTDMGGDEGPAPQTYQGEDLLFDSPNRVESLMSTYRRPTDLVDAGIGTVVSTSRTAFPKVATSFEWVLQGREAISAFKEYLFARRGRLKPVWIPSWHSDLHLTKAVTALDDTIAVQSIDYERFVDLQTTRRDLAFLMPDGSWRLRRITGVEAGDPGEELLTLDQQWGDDVQPFRISFLNLCRLDQDRIEIVWHTDSVAVSKASHVVVPE